MENQLLNKNVQRVLGVGPTQNPLPDIKRRPPRQLTHYEGHNENSVVRNTLNIL